MKYIKKVGIVAITICIGIMSISNAYASSDITRESKVTVTKKADGKYIEYVNEHIKENGKKYKLKKVTYDLISEKDGELKIEIKDGEEIKKNIEKNGIKYKYVKTALDKEKVVKTVEYIKREDAPAKIDDLNLESVSQKEVVNRVKMPITLNGYEGSNLYEFNGKIVKVYNSIYWDSYISDIREYLNLSLSDEIENIVDINKTVQGDKSIITANVIASAKQNVYEATYTNGAKEEAIYKAESGNKAYISINAVYEPDSISVVKIAIFSLMAMLILAAIIFFLKGYILAYKKGLRKKEKQ